MPELAASHAAAERRFLTFRIDTGLYALPVEDVAEVVRIPAVARVPLGPKCLLGLANLRGDVLPIISLRAMLEKAEAGASVASRAIVLGNRELGFTVDAVLAIVSAEVPVRMLDLDAMLAAAFGPREHREHRERGAQATVPAAVRPTAATEAAPGQLLVFEVAGQEYALPLPVVREIVALPPTIAAAPLAEAVLLGVMAHNDSLLPLLSLPALLGFPIPTGAETRQKVIVVPVGGVVVGLVADRVREVLSADPGLIDPAPSMLAARTGGEARIAAIFRGEGGRRLISVLAPEQLFRGDVMRHIGSSSDGIMTLQAVGDPSEAVRFLVFRLGAEEYGLPVGAVDEVARVPGSIIRVPRTPDFIEGVSNLRGEVLPVIDQRRRFGMPASTGTGRRLVVVRTQRHRAGLIVDSVSEVLRSTADMIKPAPEIAGNATARLVNGVINLPETGRMILLLDPAEVLSHAERGLLDAFAARSRDTPKL
jgi:purine-binding chemotaxis protein CheW